MRERIRGLIGAGLLAVLALLSYPAMSAGSVAGEPITAEFNYVGVFVGTTIAGDAALLAHRPSDGDPVALNGEYTDAAGNFKVPSDGLVFPRITVDLDLFELYGEISLAGEGNGNYDQSTGEMKLDLDLALTLAVDDLEALSNETGIPLGTGALACRLSPLETSLSTDGTWPDLGKAYENKADLVDGALAGNWRKKPAATAVKGDQATCNIVAGFLKPVGGLWLANSTETIDELPGWDMGKCPPPGAVQFQLSCIDPKCPEGQAGHFSNCEDEECPPPTVADGPFCVIIDPMTELTKVVGPKQRKVRAGKTSELRIRVKARVGLGPDVFRIKLRSSNRQVKVPKSVLVKLAGSTGIVTVKLKATRKARGKATITAFHGKLKAVTKVTVKKAVKRKKKKK